MSKLAKLLGKPKKYTIGGEELEFKPRKLKDLDLLMDLAEENKRSDALKKLIKVTLKEAEPEATDEELDGIAFTYFDELTRAILDVNGVKESGLHK